MPRLDHRIALEQCSYDVQMVLTLVMQEVNVLRQAVGLPPRTPQQVRQALRQYILEHPRPTREGE